MKIVPKLAGGAALLSLTACMDPAQMDATYATAFGAAVGGAAANSVFDGNNAATVAGAALGGGLANAWIETQQACRTTDQGDRVASRDNLTGRVAYDETTQVRSIRCTKNSPSSDLQGGGVVPIFR